MMWRLAIGALAMLVLGAAGAPVDREALPGILGKDDRVILDNSNWPWAAIGRVNRGSGGFCTGTLVASDLVLTAAHCLYDRRTGKRVSPDNLHFVASYRRGDYAAHSVASASFHPPAFSYKGGATFARIANDWALLVLRHPMALKPIPVRRLSDEEKRSTGPASGKLMRAGYGQDRPHLLSLHAGCSISADRGDGNVLFHTCDATRGGSGSPLIIKTEDGYVIVALAIGVANGEGMERGLAVNAAAFEEKIEQALALLRIPRGHSAR
jgi:protease YdgD